MKIMKCGALIFFVILLFSAPVLSLPEIPRVNFSVYCDKYHISSFELPYTASCRILNSGNVEDLYEVRDYCNNNSFIARENFSVTFSSFSSSQCQIKISSLARPDLTKTVTFYFESDKVKEGSSGSSHSSFSVFGNYAGKVNNNMTNISSFKAENNTSISGLESMKGNSSALSRAQNNSDIFFRFKSQTKEKLPSGRLTIPGLFKLLFVIFAISVFLFLIAKKRKIFFLALIFVVLIFPCHSFTCDAGNLSGVCIVNSTQDVSGENIVAEKLIVEANARLYTRSEIIANISAREIILNGTMEGNFNISANILKINGKISADGKGSSGCKSSISEPERVNVGGCWFSELSDWQKPFFAGSSGHTKRGNGGGILILKADEIVVNGEITSNGRKEIDDFWHRYGGGFGGYIKIEAINLSGNGYISANGNGGAWSRYPYGVRYDYCTVGGGGVIIINVTNNYFTGRVEAKGGYAKSGNAECSAGAGIIYYPAEGRIVIDNGKHIANRKTYLRINYLEDLVLSNATLSIESNLTISKFNSNSRDFVVRKNSKLLVDKFFNFPTAENLVVEGEVIANSSKIVVKNGKFNFSKVIVNGTITTFSKTPLVIKAKDLVINGIISADGKGYYVYEDGTKGNYLTEPSFGYSLGSITQEWTYSGNLINKPIPHFAGVHTCSGEPCYGSSARGPGIIKIYSENLTVNGTITSEGIISQRAGTNGGYIEINAKVLKGNGIIKANGKGRGWSWRDGWGVRYDYCWVGGGGVIILNITSNQFEGKVEAKGGKAESGGAKCLGGAGIVYLKKEGKIILDNGMKGLGKRFTHFSISGNLSEIILANGSKLKLENSRLSSEFLGIGNYSLYFENSRISIFNSSIDFSAKNSNISLFSSYSNYFLENSSLQVYWKLRVRTNIFPLNLKIFDRENKLIANSTFLENYTVVFPNGKDFVYLLEFSDDGTRKDYKTPYKVWINGEEFFVNLSKDYILGIFNGYNNSVSGGLAKSLKFCLCYGRDFYKAFYGDINRSVACMAGREFRFLNLTPGFYFIIAIKNGKLSHYSDVFYLRQEQHLKVNLKPFSENNALEIVKNISLSFLNNNTFYLAEIINSSYSDIFFSLDPKQLFSLAFTAGNCIAQVGIGLIPSYDKCVLSLLGEKGMEELIHALKYRYLAPENFELMNVSWIIERKDPFKELEKQKAYQLYKEKIEHEIINFYNEINLSENEIKNYLLLLKEQESQARGKSVLPFGWVLTPKQNLINVLEEFGYREGYFGLRDVKETAGTAAKILTVVSSTTAIISKYLVTTGRIEAAGALLLISKTAELGTYISKSIEISALTAMTSTFIEAISVWPESLAKDYQFLQDNLKFLKQDKAILSNISKISGEIKSINLEPDFEILGRKFIFANEPKDSVFKVIASKNVSISVKSLTPFNLSARVIAISDFLTISDKFNLSYNQEKSLELPFSSTFKLETILEPKLLTLAFVLGPKIVDIKVEDFYVTPKANFEILEKRFGIAGKVIKVAKTTFASYLFPILLDPEEEKKEFNLTYLPNISWVTFSLSSENPSYFYTYNFSENASKVVFILVNSPYSDADLHVYCNGKHVGFNYQNSTIDLEVENSFYNGRENAIERIEVLPKSKSQCVVGIILKKLAINKTNFTLIIQEIPKRPAILAFYPFIVETFLRPGESKNFSLQFSEIGCQEDLGNISLEIENNSSLMINLSSFNFNLSRCQTKTIDLRIALPENISLKFDSLNIFQSKVMINSSLGRENLTIRVFVFPKLLRKGWNLVSLPFDLGINKVGDLLDILPNCTSEVLVEWKGNNSYGVLFGNETLDYTGSYWIYSCKNQTWYLEGFERNQTQILLRRGWNFVSLPLPLSYNLENFSLNCSGIDYNLSQAVENGIISKPLVFEKSWNFSNVFKPSQGFILYSNQTCILSYKR